MMVPSLDCSFRSPESYKNMHAGPILCDSDLIGLGLWPGSQRFKSSLGDSNA